MNLFWYRTDVLAGKSYEMEFHIAANIQVLNSSSPMLIGREDLSKHPNIDSEIDGAHIFTRTKAIATEGEHVTQILTFHLLHTSVLVKLIEV